VSPHWACPSLTRSPPSPPLTPSPESHGPLKGQPYSDNLFFSTSANNRPRRNHTRPNSDSNARLAPAVS